MNIIRLTQTLLLGIGAGCASMAPPPAVSVANLPNCFDSNYIKDKGLFTIRDPANKSANQQCLLMIGAHDASASASQLNAGSYTVYLSDGGGSGAGGTLQPFFSGFGAGGGGGGGGGAGAKETKVTIDLAEGAYKLTIGAGGPAGAACDPSAGFGGGPGWLGSPSSMVRIATSELVIGTAGADTYQRPSRFRNERLAGKRDAHGGSGPGQTSGGHGTVAATAAKPSVPATSGGSSVTTSGTVSGGTVAPTRIADKTSGLGGGGGATSMGQGGEGGGESPGQRENPPDRGTLGSGGGGGEGSVFECDAGGRGGDGYIALRPMRVALLTGKP